MHVQCTNVHVHVNGPLVLSAVCFTWVCMCVVRVCMCVCVCSSTQMLFTLVNKGANSLWEHALHNSSSKVKVKKPNYRDKLQ